ncbi:hypothetical protein BDZ90DRAFT_142194 [Jaminaea rosea]|uniref:Uncharacterized protein n=1 Tax=Jaminaea rosea TaxID=1569628 RepID=A0A316UWR4_9BASI|nr:hypothetical protein BDZ90DRAFT_142194 [Jaminaea rosea]PWN29238.1 hypothetical protein BDZ90DRAFT_142194 [Jaminaea rosea]
MRAIIFTLAMTLLVLLAGTHHCKADLPPAPADALVSCFFDDLCNDFDQYVKGDKSAHFSCNGIKPVRAGGSFCRNCKQCPCKDCIAAKYDQGKCYVGYYAGLVQWCG